MPGTAPALLTPRLLAAHRPGAQCFVAEGSHARLPRRRPRGYLRAARLGLRAEATTLGGKAAVEEAKVPAIVEVRGVLEQRASLWSCGESSGYDELEERFAAAVCDPGVSAVILDMDSPGGDGAGLEQLVGKCRRLADEIGKPILGYVNEFAASAALWILVGVCDAIYLPPSGQMGSIGCVVPFATEARALRKAGVDPYIARAPAGKMRPNPIEALDPIGKARLDQLAAEGEARFVAAIAARRGVQADVIRGWNAGLFTGAAAVSAKLADGLALAGLDTVIAYADELGAQRSAA